MSRLGKQHIPIPSGVEVNIADTNVSVKGPKGALQLKIHPAIYVMKEGQDILVSIKEDKTNLDHFHGLYRTLIHNMVMGTSKGFEKRLELIGVGYKATLQGEEVVLQLGFSHPSKLAIPKGLSLKIEEKNTLIIISGCDKQLVGQFAATIRSLRPPEPYQGKGIRYQGEFVRKKAGKAAAKK